MLLMVLLLFGLPLWGMYLAILAVIATVRRRNAMRSLSLGATSMTACLFGAVWFFDNEGGLLKAGLMVAVAACLWVYADAWARLRHDPVSSTGRIRRHAFDVSLVPLVTFAGAAVGYFAGSRSHHLSDRQGLFLGQIVGLLAGCGNVLRLSIGRRPVGTCVTTGAPNKALQGAATISIALPGHEVAADAAAAELGRPGTDVTPKQQDPPVWAQVVIVAFGALLGAFVLHLLFGKIPLIGDPVGLSLPYGKAEIAQEFGAFSLGAILGGVFFSWASRR